jgi:arabinogalactan endo-1,4-beta-galactosidase
MKPKAFVTFSLLIFSVNILSQSVYVGTSMSFADYLEKNCGVVYKEEGFPADPFISIKSHGATIARLEIQLPPYSSSYSNGEIIDYSSVKKIKISMQRVKEAGLKTLLTFTYRSFALEDSQRLNEYVAPLAWQSIASDIHNITDSVYAYTFATLDDYCSSGLIPEIVSIGNESVWRRLEPNLPEDQLPAYDPRRSVEIHNAGSRAVRDIAAKYHADIKVCYHMMGPSRTKWWLETHSPYGLDFDMIGISLYYGWNENDYAGYNSLGDYVAAIIKTYKVEFIVMETAQLFTVGGSDNHVDILGTENIPPGYPNPPTIQTQKQYLTDITKEVLDNGGSGVLVWGGDWVASDCFVYADPWGPGSSWENKTFWDFDYNLHDGVNWMMAFGQEPTSLSEAILNRPDFLIFPNPVQDGNFSLKQNSNSGEIQGSVYDLDGNVILTFHEIMDNYVEKQYALPENLRGLFILEIRSDKYVKHIKICKGL